jgi:4-hydroxybenzoate polyprenyltransferase
VRAAGRPLNDPSRPPRFGARGGGNPEAMIGLALALIVVGLVIGFLIPPYGFVASAAGLVLLILFLVGFGRRATRTREL